MRLPQKDENTSGGGQGASPRRRRTSAASGGGRGSRGEARRGQRMTNRRSFTPGILGCLGVGFALTAVSPTVAFPVQLSYEVSSSPDVVVLQLSENVGIRDADNTPLVRVYGDGRVAVHFPAYMRRAGDYELRLPERAVQEFFRAAVETLLPFDGAATESRVLALEAAERSDGLIVDVSDAATTIVEVRFERYRPEGAAEGILGGVKRVVWTGLADDAGRFGDIPALQDLAGIQRELLALTDHPDLEAVTGR